MANHHSWYQPIFSAFSLVIVILLWMMMAPSEVGGQTTYIILVGNSMEPGFFKDDLVLVRASADYEQQDIVAYRQPDVGSVFHRIIRVENDRFVLKGDNNSWEDSYCPVQQEIIGKYWLRIPKVGGFLRILRTPVGFSFVVVFFSLLILMSIFSDWLYKNNEKSGANNTNSIKDSPNLRFKGMSMDKKSSDSLYLLSAIGFALVMLALVSFSNPIESTAADNYDFTSSGIFEYSCAVPEDIYDDDSVKTGDPIYRQLNNAFSVYFTYELSTKKALEDIQGTYQMSAIVSEASGWQRSIELIAPSLVDVREFTSAAEVDLDAIQSLIDNFEQQTGVSSNRYTLTIQPEVDLTALLGGRELEESFSPQMQFNLDDQKLVLLDDNSDAMDTLHPTQGGVVPGSRKTANTISILGLQLNVLLARIIAVYGILCVAVAVIWMLKRNGIIHSNYS